MIGLIPFGSMLLASGAALSGSSFRDLKYFILPSAPPWRAGGFGATPRHGLVVGVIRRRGSSPGTGSAHGVGKFLTLATSAAAVGFPWIAITLTYPASGTADSARGARDSGMVNGISIGATEPGTPPSPGRLRSCSIL